MEIIIEIIGEFIFWGMITIFDENLDREMKDSERISPFKLLLYILWIGLTAVITYIAIYFTYFLVRDFDWLKAFVAVLLIGFASFAIIRSVRYTKILFFSKKVKE